MPQISKGGKFIFGLSQIYDDYRIILPTQAVQEYSLTEENQIILLTGSKCTGGFCITRKGLLESSRLKHILIDNPILSNYECVEGEFIRYKGRFYCWKEVAQNGTIRLNKDMLDFLDLKIGQQLLSIRSSNIAFTMGAKGPLLEKARLYRGNISLY